MELAFTAMYGTDIKEISVISTDNVHKAIAKIFETPKGFSIMEVRFGGGGEYVEPGLNVEDSGIDDGARLEVSFRKATVKEVVLDIVHLNPHLTQEPLMRQVKVDPDDASRVLRHVYWAHFSINCLPESIGDLTVDGSLYLYSNNLATLPESFGSLTVGHDLDLPDNNLKTLPDTFGSLNVGGNLGLSYNNLATLPESFSKVTVGGKII